MSSSREMETSKFRPHLLVVVVGTGTEVGKTWVAARLLRDLRAEGFDVAARKPVQSFDPGDRLTDAHVLAEASGEDPADVSPRHRWYPVPMAPPMAAEALGRAPFTIADLVDELSWPVLIPDVGMVETAGGVRSPQAADGDAITLIEALQPDLILVIADAGLGTINSIRLTLEAIDRGSHVATPIVVLNRFDPADDLHCRNRDWLESNLEAEILASVPAVMTRLRRR
ncbi:BioD Dethiobiotin synthetase [Acidimicrobiia bacterium]